MFDRSRKGEHALLIQTHSGGPAEEDVLEEFADLARSAGATVAATLTARIDKPNPSTLIGSGKLEEIKAAAEATGADLVLVNHTLSPGQERNLERYLERRVIDRTGLILDIFAQRARSHEGKLQVELAQLRHMATRLVRGWTHLERQRGGSIGLRGPGETQLETDRRLLQKRVEQLQQRLEKVEVQRTQMRRARMRSELPRIALVGYTNAGKSTLFNALTGAEAYVADQLFATLDPTVRRIALPGAVRSWPIRSASCAICRINWSLHSVRPCPRRATPICCYISSMRPTRCAKNASSRSMRCCMRWARAICRSCWCSTRSTRSKARRCVTMRRTAFPTRRGVNACGSLRGMGAGCRNCSTPWGSDWICAM